MNGAARSRWPVCRESVIALGFFVLLSLPSGAAGPEQEVREANDRRFAAMVRGDVAELGRILADDLTYTHSSSVVETKAQFLESLGSKAMVYRSIEPADVQVRVYGETALVTGRSVMQVTNRGQDLAIPLRFTAVYVRQGGAWRLVAWQSTRIPEP